MIREIIIKGKLGDKYGKKFYFDVNTPAQALSALFRQIKGFYQDFRKGNYSIFKGEIEITEEILNLSLGKSDFIIAPSIQGSGGGSLAFLDPLPAFRGFIGAAGLFFQGPAILAFNFFFPKPEDPDANVAADRRPSFLFNGPTNSPNQGIPVPLVYGKMRTGSVVALTGIQVEQVGVVTE